MRRAIRGQRSPDLCLSVIFFATYLQYDTSYQGIDARRENLRRALEVPEYYAALAKYREKIEHDPHDA